MLDKPIIVDDVICKEYQDLIENELLGINCPWYFNKDVSYNQTDPRLQNLVKGKTPVVGHMFFNLNQGPITPGLHFMTMPMALEAFNKAGIVPGHIIKSRSFLYFPLADAIRREHDSPHIDFDMPHLVCLYYVNDTDGDTFIFDKTVSDIRPDSDDFANTEFNVVQRITPKKGRAVIFDGTRYHASSVPTKDVRCIVNINFSYNL
jgi:hypothetical protein